MVMRTTDQHIDPNSTYTKFVDGLGRGLYANQDIASGDPLLLIQRPLVVSLDAPRLKDTCYACLNYKSELQAVSAGQILYGPRKLLTCTGCRVVRYCDRECQKSSWLAVHKHECSLFARLYPKVLPNNVRAIIQLLLLKAASKLPPKEWDDFMKLESHLDQWRRRGGRDWENIEVMTRGAKEYSATPLDEHVLREIFCKLLVNSFTMVGACYDPLGIALHPLAALANHSCDYNALVEFTWRREGTHPLIIRASSPIARDEQIVISYTEATNPLPWRQKELQDRYFFTCHCAKCGNQAIHEYPNDSARADTSTSSAVYDLERGIRMLRQDYLRLPLDYQPLPTLRQQLVVTLVEAGRYYTAFLHTSIQFLDVDSRLLPTVQHPLHLVHQWTVVVLTRLIYMDRLGVPVGLMLEDSSDILLRDINFQILFHYNLDDLYIKVRHSKDSFFRTVVCNFWMRAGRDSTIDLEKVRFRTAQLLEDEKDYPDCD